jgi:hypothetical protein
MKKIAIIMLAAVGLLSFTTPANATPKGTPITAPKSTVDDLVEKRIEQSVIYPTFASEAQIEGAVFVSLTVGNDGNIYVQSIEATNEALGTYVCEKLESIDLGSLKLSDALTFNYRFTFKRES